MRHVSLSPQDAALLQCVSIKYFKERFPEYAELDLSLRGNDLVIACSEKDSIGDLIRVSQIIKAKSEVAIGTNYVTLENNGKEIFRIGTSMVASIEAPEIQSSSSMNYEDERISSRQTYNRYPIPKGIRFLASVEEVATFGKMQPEELVACLDEDVQRRYKEEESRAQVEAIASRVDLASLNISVDDVLQIIPLSGLNNELGIEPKNVRAAVAWYWLWKGAEAFASIPAMAKSSIDSLSASPLADRLEVFAPTPIPPASNRVRNTTTDADSNGTKSSRLVFRGANKIVEDETTMGLLRDNKITAFVGKILEGQKQRSEEMIRSGANDDTSWQNFFAPILKARLQEINEPDREKEAERIKNAINKAFKKALKKLTATESNPDAD